MQVLRIDPKAEGKGRTFQALLIGAIEADSWWESGSSSNRRPILFSYAASDAESRSFTANLRTGRCAVTKDHAYELLRSAGYEWIQQTLPRGVTTTTAYLPELFAANPGMVDPESIRFVVVPSLAWEDDHDAHVGEDPAILAYLQQACPFLNGANGVPSPEEFASRRALAALFCHSLDCRTRAPLPLDPRFQLHLLAQCLHVKLAKWAGDRHSSDREWGYASGSEFCVTGQEMLGASTPLGFFADHGFFGQVLAETVQTFFKITGS